LLTGAAWKVIDLLLETALNLAGQVRDRKPEWSIDGKKGKVTHAENLTGRPTTFPSALWEALMKTYVKTTELRQPGPPDRVYRSLGCTGGLRPIESRTPSIHREEQEALGRAALRAAQVAVAPVQDSRLEADLTRQLSYLHGVYGVSLPTVTVVDSLPEVTAIIDADTAAPGCYLLDLPTLRTRLQVGLCRPGGAVP
jgi:hypothetical protein